MSYKWLEATNQRQKDALLRVSIKRAIRKNLKITVSEFNNSKLLTLVTLYINTLN